MSARRTHPSTFRRPATAIARVSAPSSVQPSRRDQLVLCLLGLAVAIVAMAQILGTPT